MREPRRDATTPPSTSQTCCRAARCIRRKSDARPRLISTLPGYRDYALAASFVDRSFSATGSASLASLLAAQSQAYTTTDNTSSLASTYVQRGAVSAGCCIFCLGCRWLRLCNTHTAFLLLFFGIGRFEQRQTSTEDAMPTLDEMVAENKKRHTCLGKFQKFMEFLKVPKEFVVLLAAPKHQFTTYYRFGTHADCPKLMARFGLPSKRAFLHGPASHMCLLSPYYAVRTQLADLLACEGSKSEGASRCRQVRVGNTAALSRGKLDQAMLMICTPA
eukprot:6206767-Pleurochrysis_carterae.AAC.1